MLKTIIVDDEYLSKKTLKTLIHKNCPELEIVETAYSIEEAYKLIHVIKPDLVFLDIQFPEGSGFDLLEQFDSPSFEVVFVSGCSEYALKAFHTSALGYLVKPVQVSDLQRVILKVLKKRELIAHATLKTEEFGLSRSRNFMSMKETPCEHLAIPLQQGIKMLTIKEVLRCEGSNGYTIFHLQGNRQLVSSQHMAPFAALLCQHNFFRIHTSHLINRSFIDEYSHAQGGQVLMKDGASLPVSSRRKKDFLEWLKG